MMILLDMIQLVLPRDPLGSAKAPRSAWHNRRCHWLLPGRWYVPSPPVDIRSPKDERTQKSMVRLEDDGCAVKMFISNQGVWGPKDTSFLDKFSFRPIYWGTVSAEKVDLYIYYIIYIYIYINLATNPVWVQLLWPTIWSMYIFEIFKTTKCELSVSLIVAPSKVGVLASLVENLRAWYPMSSGFSPLHLVKFPETCFFVRSPTKCSIFSWGNGWFMDGFWWFWCDFMGSTSETDEFNPKTDLGPVKQSMTLEPRVVCIRSRLLLRGPPHDTYGDIWDVGSHPPNSPSLAEISMFIIYDHIIFCCKWLRSFTLVQWFTDVPPVTAWNGTKFRIRTWKVTVLQDVQLQLKVSHAIILQSFDDESRGRGEARPRLQLLGHREPSYDSHGSSPCRGSTSSCPWPPVGPERTHLGADW